MGPSAPELGPLVPQRWIPAAGCKSREVRQSVLLGKTKVEWVGVGLDLQCQSAAGAAVGIPCVVVEEEKLPLESPPPAFRHSSSDQLKLLRWPKT